VVVHDETAVRQWLKGLLNPASCYVLIRHSNSVPDGSNQTRTLTRAGIELCHHVSLAYSRLVSALKEEFGDPVYQHSELPRTFATGWEIFHPGQFHVQRLLTLRVGLKAIQGGQWLQIQKAEGRSLAEILTTVHHYPKLLRDQPYDDAMDRMDSFFRQALFDPHRLFVGIGHEPEPSLWLLKNGQIPEEEIGLSECQAYILVRDQRGMVLGAIKFAPLSATRPSA
jgi:hypothetical protein